MLKSLIGVLVIIVIGVGAYFAFAIALQPKIPDAAGSSSDERAEAVPVEGTPATIEYVHDGDTLFLTDGRKVRLLGINTPEIGDNAECFGEEATAIARQLLPVGSAVSVLADVEPLDQYGRSLLFISAADGTNINVELLRLGAAEVEMYEPNVLFRAEVEAAEREAQAAGVGIWGEC